MPYMLPRRVRVPLKAKPEDKDPFLSFCQIPDKHQDPSHPRKPLTSTIPVAVDPWKQQQKVINHRFYTRQYTNSYTPFYTLQKPSCGFLYCQETDHTRKRLDVPYTNVNKWRTDAIL